MTKSKILEYNYKKFSEHGYSDDDVKNMLTKHNYKKYKINNCKYVAYKIISEKPFKIIINLYQKSELKKSIILSPSKTIALKLAIIFGLENNDPNPNGIIFLKHSKKDYPYSLSTWKQIQYLIRKNNLKVY